MFTNRKYHKRNYWHLQKSHKECPFQSIKGLCVLEQNTGVLWQRERWKASQQVFSVLFLTNRQADEKTFFLTF